MRRVHLRGHENILKRVLLQAGACNLGLLMRHLVGVGTPRSLQGRALGVLASLCTLLVALPHLWDAIWTHDRPFVSPDRLRPPRTAGRTDLTITTTCPTAC